MLSVILRLCLFLVPLGLLLYGGLTNTVRRVDSALSQSAPLVSDIATRILQRPVNLGHLQSNLSVARIWSMLQHRDSLGTFPISADDITVATARTTYTDAAGHIAVFDEPRLAGSAVLAHAPRVALLISLPALLTGDFNNTLTRVEVDSPELILVRDNTGQFNFLHLVPKNPAAKPGPPFRTVIEVLRGRLRFRDYASLSSPGALAQNDLAGINGTADLSSAANYRFAATAAAAPGTPTVERFRGRINLDGAWGRTAPGVLPDSPSKESARFLIHLTATDGDAPYWLYYAVKVGGPAPTKPSTPEVFHMDSGRASVDVTVAAPRPDITSGPTPGIGISLVTQFRDGRISTGYSPAGITDASGRLDYEDGTVTFKTSARLLGRSASAAGALWGLTPDASGNRALNPELAINFHASRLPALKSLLALLPTSSAKSLPSALQIGGDIGVDGLVSGPMRNPVVTARVSGVAVAVHGLPRLTAGAANIEFASGVLAISNVTARTDGGGTISGRAAIRVLAAPGAPIGDTQFAVRADGIDLRDITALQAMGRNANPNLRLSGKGSVDTVGTRSGGVLHAAANVRTQGLSVGSIAFPVAQARLLLTNNGPTTTVLLPSARLESGVGALDIAGAVNAVPGKPGALSLRWTATALDLAALSRAAGIKGVAASGLITAAGTIGGTPSAPRGAISDLVALNLRLRTSSAGQPSMEFALDSLRGSGIIVTPNGIRISRPVVIRRFPARLTIAGTIDGLRPDARGAFDPRFNLSASIFNLDSSEIERQLKKSVAAAAKEALLAPGAVVDAATPGFAGAIARASVRAVGRLSAIKLSGSAVFGNILAGSYPLDGGSVDFTYDKASGTTTVRNATLLASVGKITGNARLLAGGALSGDFLARGIDLSKLSFLTSKTAPDQGGRYVANGFAVGGVANISGRIAGTVRAPVVTAEILPSTVVVAGVPLSDIVAQGIRYSLNPDTGATHIDIPSLSLHQRDVAAGGDTSLTLKNFHVDLPTGQVSLDLAAESTDIGVLLATLETSEFADTAAGQGILNAIEKNVPSPVGGRFAIDHLTIRGKIAAGGVVKGKPTYRFTNGTGDLVASGSDLRFGTFVAPKLDAHATLSGERVLLETLTATTPGTPDVPGTTFRGHGVFGLNDGSINAVVESNAASIASLRLLRPLQSLPLRGNVDLSVLLRRNAAGTTVTGSIQSVAGLGQGSGLDVYTDPRATEAVGTAAESKLSVFHLDLVRAEGQYVVDPNGVASILVPDALISHGGASVHLAGSIPLSSSAADTSLSTRPIALTVSVPPVDLREFAPLFGAPEKNKKGKLGKAIDLGGMLSLNLALGGTVANPQLSGDIILDKGHLTLPSAPGETKDRINPIKNIDAHLVLADNKIDFQTFNLDLGGPDKRTGNFGSVKVAGNIALNGITQLGRLLRAGGDTSGDLDRIVLDDILDLTVTATDLRPVDDNLFGYGEFVEGKVNGVVTVTGAAQHPLIASGAINRVRVADAYLRVTSAAPPAPSKAAALPINPTFDVPIEIVGKAVVTDGAVFRFEANGGARIKGSLADQGGGFDVIGKSGLDINAVLNVVGGWFSLPTARFTVKRSNAVGSDGSTSASDFSTTESQTASTVTLRYNSANPSVIANNIKAVTRVYVASGNNIGTYAQRVNGAFQTSSSPISSPASSGPSTAYTITATINGPLNILTGDPASGEGAAAPQKSVLSFSSVPSLEQPQIIALLGTQQQLDQARNGDVTGALASLSNSILYQRFLPQYLSPLTNGIQTALRLEDFTFNYDPSGVSQIFAAKRLPNPFQRFVIDYTQQLQTRQTAQQPYLFRLSYELFQFKPTKGIQPRLQVGFSSDQQHVTKYFFQSSASF